MDTTTDWDLTHRNNNFLSLKVSSQLKEKYPPIKICKYIPSLFPESKILTKELLPKLWGVIPVDVKFNDGLLVFDKISSPEAYLCTLYKICDKLDDIAMMMFSYYKIRVGKFLEELWIK